MTYWNPMFSLRQRYAIELAPNRRRTRVRAALEPEFERCALDRFGLEQCVDQLVSRRCERAALGQPVRHHG
jgi:hypothetical protein